MPLALPLQRLVLGCQGLLFLFQRQAASLILRSRDALYQVRLGQAVERMGYAGVRSAPWLLAGLYVLGQPGPPRGARPGLSNASGLTQQVTESLPDQVIEGGAGLSRA